MAAKVVGPLSGLMSQDEWEAFYTATGQGYLSVMLVVTSETLEKLNAGKGEVLLMAKNKVVVALIPAAAVVSAYDQEK